ncbi:MAG: hypothetical protein WBP29_04720 [Candidatus Zixiibacteriota bacterium]
MFTIIAVCGSAGAVMGAKPAQIMIGSVGIYELLSASGGLLLISLLITTVSSRGKKPGDPTKYR